MEKNEEQVVDNTEELEEQIVEEVEVTDEKAVELNNELDTITKEKDELYQKLLRLQADFDNFRKRSSKERENDLKYKSQELATELLPVVDNFERALQVKVEDEKTQSFVDGMQMIYRQLLQAFDKAGIEEIKAEGEPFDPQYHQAVMQVNEDDKQSNSVLEVLQKGYRLRDRVIRPAMVKVNQ